MTTTSPDADVRLPDVFDFEGVPRAPHRHCDTVAVPAMEIGLTGIAQLRKALDEGEPGIREYLARTAGEANGGGAKAEYPEHARLMAVKDRTQAVGEFLEWLGTQGITLAVREPEWDRLMPAHAGIEDLLGRWAEIDPGKIEAEKRQMLASIRAGHAQADPVDGEGSDLD
jgi:hypothetical protein